MMAMSQLDGAETVIKKPEGEGRQRFHRLSTRKFIPEGDEVSRVLILLPSFTFRRHGSQLGDSSITMTVMSATECAPLFKCSAAGETSVLRCVMSDRWPLILAWSGWLVSPMYWRPHLLHVIRYTLLEELQVERNFTLNNCPVVWLENPSVTFNVGQVLHLGALDGCPAWVVSWRHRWTSLEAENLSGFWDDGRQLMVDIERPPIVVLKPEE